MPHLKGRSAVRERLAKVETAYFGGLSFLMFPYIRAFAFSAVLWLLSVNSARGFSTVLRMRLLKIRQFSSNKNQEPQPSMSTDDEWSVSSDADHTADHSSALDEEIDETFSLERDPAIRQVDSSQPHFKRPSEAFPAAFEDPLQSSKEIAASANTRVTEFFDLTPPGR